MKISSKVLVKGARSNATKKNYPQSLTSRVLYKNTLIDYKEVLTEVIDAALVTCGICLEIYDMDNPSKVPRTLPHCGHSLCCECLEKLLALSEEHLICHICKKHNKLPKNKSMEEFPCTWAIVKLVEDFPIKITNNNSSICSVCSQHEISHYCRQHLFRLCAYCAFRHIKECKDNMMIELSSLPSFYKNTINKGESLIATINEKILQAKQVKVQLKQQMADLLNDLIKSYKEKKEEVMCKMDLYVLQLTLLKNSLIQSLNEAMEKKKELPLNTSKINSVIKNTNKLETLIEKTNIDQAYKLSTQLNQCSSYINSIFSNLQIISPYTSTSSTRDNYFIACGKGDLAIIDFLLSRMGIDKNIKDNTGRTAFNIAVSKLNTELYKLLYEKYKCNVNIADNTGKTPLIYACLNNDLVSALYLLKKCKADVNLQDKWKDSALHLAVERKNLELVKVLVEIGKADVNLVNGKGKTVLEIAESKDIKEYLSQYL